MPGIDDILIANIREKETSLIPLLEQQGVVIKFTPLKLVDFIAAGKIAIIKRTMDEFVAELKNKMVYRTALEFKRDFPDPLYIVEGIQTSNGSSAAAIRAGITYLTVLSRIPIIFTTDEADTSEYIALLIKQGQFAPERETPQMVEEKDQYEEQPGLENYQEQIVSRLPGVSPSTVKTLMSKYPNLKALFSASENELKNIKSIGPKRAKSIVQALAAPLRGSVKVQR